LSALAAGISLAIAVTVSGVLLMRFGPGGALGARALARGLHASAGRRRIARRSSEVHARLFGASGGRLLGHWFGAPVLVIETLGRRSGLPRRTPIVYARDGDHFVVTPANAGVDRVPAWWLNLRASGTATALVGGRRVAVRAVERAEGAAEQRLWRLLVDMSPAIAHYQTFTDRGFPVVVLEPLPAPDGAPDRARTASPEGRLRDQSV
jgi:deazaflavin-dependent oxidoreductase (nitroreductase family)